MTGTRIRDRRLDAGLRQADLAKAVGISPSYLNLIEHNKRRIGGKLLADLARELGIEAGLLTDGADLELIDQLRSAAADIENTKAEIDRVEELVTRYPGWAAVMEHQMRRITQLETQIRDLSDRMAHDPKLATALHDLISAVTSIRSTSGILVDDDQLDRDWQQRFHRNIHDESVRLAAESEALITYLEAPRTHSNITKSPFDEATGYLSDLGFHVPALEKGGHSAIAELVAASGLSGGAQQLLSGWLTDYAHLCETMPIDAFADAARDSHYDPVVLSQQFGAGLAAVLRRLASLPLEGGHPPTGLVVCDSSGVMTYLKPVAGFSMARQTGGCPLWPLYQALTQPNQPIRAEVALPDTSASRLLCYAVTEQRGVPSFDLPPLVQSTMLVFPDVPQTEKVPRPVGLTCRICPRDGCHARREPVVA